MIFINNLYWNNFIHYDLINIILISFRNANNVYSVSKRHEKLFESKYQQNKIFNKDVLYGVTISPIILYYLK